MKYLASEYAKGAIIHGLPVDSYIHYCSQSTNLQSLNKLNDPLFRHKQSNLYREFHLESKCMRPPYPFSVIKFELLSGCSMHSEFHLLISKLHTPNGLLKNINNIKNEFIIGRAMQPADSEDAGPGGQQPSYLQTNRTFPGNGAAVIDAP